MVSSGPRVQTNLQVTDGAILLTVTGEPAGRPPTSEPLDDPLSEALRLVDLAKEHGLRVRLVGGLAIQARVPGWNGGSTRAALARRDIDLATDGRDARAVSQLLVGRGYLADTHYNALYGRKQLYFVDPRHDRPVDVVIDVLEMCHRLPFRDRLAADYPTLPLADLLLSKLQVVQLNHKDVVDAMALLSRFPLADTDVDAIRLTRIVELTSNDWGWWRTVSGNLDRLAGQGPLAITPGELGSDHTPFDPWVQARALRDAMDAAPKSQRWGLRARIGDRVRWYEEPEEVGHR